MRTINTTDKYNELTFFVSYVSYFHYNYVIHIQSFMMVNHTSSDNQLFMIISSSTEVFPISSFTLPTHSRARWTPISLLSSYTWTRLFSHSHAQLTRFFAKFKQIILNFFISSWFILVLTLCFSYYCIIRYILNNIL